VARARILIVAPSWIGDSILSEPLIALVRQPYEEPQVDVLAPPWCAPVYARMRGIRKIIEAPFSHGRFDLPARRALGTVLRAENYSRAIVLPNTWKSALVPWFAKIPLRTGYVGEARWALLNDPRKLQKLFVPRLVNRYAALAAAPGKLMPAPPAPVLVPNVANRSAAVRTLSLKTHRPVAVLCPGAEFGAAKRWPPKPKTSAAGSRWKISETRAPAYRSPDGSPHEIMMRIAAGPVRAAAERASGRSPY